MPVKHKAPGYSSSDQIRSRLLYRLGVATSAPTSRRTSPQMASTRPKILPFPEPLKCPDEEEGGLKYFAGTRQALTEVTNDNPISDYNDAASSVKISSHSPCSAISFDPQVSVLMIPTRHEYSQRTQSRLWLGKEELGRMAQRNLMEVAYEGWDWRGALEEPHMFFSRWTGDYIHPVHCCGPLGRMLPQRSYPLSRVESLWRRDNGRDRAFQPTATWARNNLNDKKGSIRAPRTSRAISNGEDLSGGLSEARMSAVTS